VQEQVQEAEAEVDHMVVEGAFREEELHEAEVVSSEAEAVSNAVGDVEGVVEDDCYVYVCIK
jgi:hypothetical protein